ncbi:MAG: flagellar assembly protein FliW [Eubacteriales bacterium]
MVIETKCFGTIEIDEEKIITFEDGLLGLEEFKKYTIIYDSEDNRPIISWLQSVEEKDIALPVINPLIVKAEYSPKVEDELLSGLGELNEDNFIILTIVVIRDEGKKVTTNLKAPLIMNVENRKGVQVITENEDYDIRYDITKGIGELKKEKVGE